MKKAFDKQLGNFRTQQGGEQHAGEGKEVLWQKLERAPFVNNGDIV